MTKGKKMNQQNFLKAFKKSQGVISTACDIVGITRTTFYRWMKEDEGFKEECESIEESEVDFVESQLKLLIKGQKKKDEEGKETDEFSVLPCKTSIIFYLKTKGKSRGYVERYENLVGEFQEQEFFPDVEKKNPSEEEE